MSLYNMLFGRNPLAELYLAMLNLTLADVGRFRDCYARKTDKGEFQIVVFTRNGGGNREEYEGTTAALREHEHYVTDFDDDFDCTYASYVFKVPPQFEKAVRLITEEEPNPPTPMERFKGLLDKLQNGDENDPQVKHAKEVGEKILAPVIDELGKQKP